MNMFKFYSPDFLKVLLFFTFFFFFVSLFTSVLTMTKYTREILFEKSHHLYFNTWSTFSVRHVKRDIKRVYEILCNFSSQKSLDLKRYQKMKPFIGKRQDSLLVNELTQYSENEFLFTIKMVYFYIKTK